MTDRDATVDLRDRVRAACEAGARLRIQGGGSKQFYGRRCIDAEVAILETAEHRGITAYDPAELVLTARAGTPLALIEQTLAEAGQCLPFEPPHFGTTATLGGTVACGIAGPARAYRGAIKDFVLGVTLLTGDARVLRFGGQVIKNVAGYDVARAMVGAMGSMGVLLDISLKVLPRSPQEQTLQIDCDAASALVRLSAWAQRPSCLSASCWLDGSLYLRLSGSAAAIQSAQAQFGGRTCEQGGQFWRSIREQTHPFFETASLFRIVLPGTAPASIPEVTRAGAGLIEWGGSQRWLAGSYDLAQLHSLVQSTGGFVTHFRGAAAGAAVFSALPAAVTDLHRSLKAVFDPRGILNSGRMYTEF